MKYYLKLAGSIIRRMLGLSPDITQEDIDRQMMYEEQQQERPQERLTVERPYVGRVVFDLLNNGEVQVQLDFPDQSKTGARIYARLLNSITTGELDRLIRAILVEYGENNVQQQDFINQILTKWNQVKAKKSHKGIAPPSQILGAGWHRFNPSAIQQQSGQQ